MYWFSSSFQVNKAFIIITGVSISRLHLGDTIDSVENNKAAAQYKLCEMT